MSVEMIDDVWIEGLDADAQEAITSTLAKRVDATRETHARLATSRGAGA
ncbi:hypothetical protein [Streptomyces sp. A30]